MKLKPNKFYKSGWFLYKTDNSSVYIMARYDSKNECYRAITNVDRWGMISEYRDIFKKFKHVKEISYECFLLELL